jgi:ribonuclease P protein component
MSQYTFKKNQRLLHRKEFHQCRRDGQTMRNRFFIINIRENGLGYNRLGITVPKRVGNAVVRNRVKRWLRELFRQKELFAHFSGRDVSVVVLRDKNFTYNTLKKSIYETFS